MIETPCTDRHWGQRDLGKPGPCNRCVSAACQRLMSTTRGVFMDRSVRPGDVAWWDAQTSCNDARVLLSITCGEATRMDRNGFVGAS